MAKIYDAQAEKATGQLWSMGSVVRRTGISEHSLRAWEKRFGFPVPIRLPSGHRRYTSQDVHRLVMIASALDLGHRAGDVVRTQPERLAELIGRSVRPVGPADGDDSAGRWVHRVVDAAVQFDRRQVAAEIRQSAASSSTLEFLSARVAPLLAEVGERWRRGDLDIRHEHFVSEVVEDELRSLRRSLEERPFSASILLAGLPEEQHSLGLQMVGLLAASLGVRPFLLGVRVPIDEIAGAADAVSVTVVGLTVSGAAESTASREHVLELRQHLSADCRLWLGGRGATKLGRLPGEVSVLPTLEHTQRALIGLGGGSGARGA